MLAAGGFSIIAWLPVNMPAHVYPPVLPPMCSGYETMKAASADAMPPITSDGVREQHQQVLRLSSLLTAIQTLAQQAAQDGTDTAVEATGKAATANSGQATFKASEASNIFKAANTATVVSWASTV